MTGVAAFLSVSVGAVAIGCIFGCVTAVVTRYTNEVRVVEPLAVIGLAYMAYLTAELVHFSGIIAIICCGLVQVSVQFCFYHKSTDPTKTPERPAGLTGRLTRAVHYDFYFSYIKFRFYLINT